MREMHSMRPKDLDPENVGLVPGWRYETRQQTD